MSDEVSSFRAAERPGGDRLSSDEVPDAERFVQVFCTTCGSKMPRRNLELDYADIPMGALDDPQPKTLIGARPKS